MIKIFLDPGHGGNDPGAQANGLSEKDVTLAIALRIKKMLLTEYERVSVKMSRTGDQTVSLKERTNNANHWGANFYLSIHINAGGGVGYEDFIYEKLSDRSYTAKLREVIHNEIIKVNSMYDRGKKKANFHVLRESAMPAMLTESGFIDQKDDVAKIKQSIWLDQVAHGHVSGLVKALGLIKKSHINSIRYLEIITDSLWTYHTEKWSDRAVIVRKGEVFTIIKDKFPVKGGFMYQLKSGLYITASQKYVREYLKRS